MGGRAWKGVLLVLAGIVVMGEVARLAMRFQGLGANGPTGYRVDLVAGCPESTGQVSDHTASRTQSSVTNSSLSPSTREADELVGLHNVNAIGSVQCAERACAYRWLCWTGEDRWTLVHHPDLRNAPRFVADPNPRAGPHTKLNISAVPGHLQQVFLDAEFLRGTFAVMSPYYNLNAGHIMGDEVFPIFNSAEQFGMQGHVNVLYTGDGKHQGTRNKLLVKSFGFIDATLWFNWPPSFSHPMCFERVLVGWERRGYSLSRYN
mgnify:CR=1 FL=1